ncbi:DUF2953 domain-containing protein [Tissierella creatinini]|nr:DUF2953 domain-containing protein [Tissierella creatinini]TJX60112.1 DUF2953 domain-containing protein [Soehngenia saccharolytica]
MIILKITLNILLVIVILLFSIVLIPYTYVVNGNEERIKFIFSWLFLKVTYVKNFHHEDEFLISLFNFNKIIQTSQDKKSKMGKKKKDKKKKKRPNGIKINRGIINQVIILFKRVWNSIKPRVISIDARVGFNDPMYTGILYGLYCQFSYLFRKYDINFQPVFDDEVYRGRFFIKGRIWLIYLIIGFLRFFISSPIRKEVMLYLNRKGS